MATGICTIAFIPMRQEPSHKSEMVSQIVFGEMYTILEEDREWGFVKNHFDSYEGWVDKNQVQIIDQEEVVVLQKSQYEFPVELNAMINVQSEDVKFNIPFGSQLFGQSTFAIAGKEYLFESKCIELSKDIRSQIVDLAMDFINVPYLWGGRTPFGIDCSGFTQMIFKPLGFNLLRDASQQAGQGQDIGFVNEANPGDLAFFGDEESISHVGIVAGEGKIIHASGRVRIDKLDHHGIYNLESKKYSHKLRVVKDLIG